ncbi:hypothetical protein FJZ31_28030 [Candidatus Poribacteria bacterium]|nr:hypothetical protein [Candidatus Poribacteria bacterium]
MVYKIEHVFNAPFAKPNGLETAADGLWAVDQVTERVAKLSYQDGSVLAAVETESHNTSGLTYGDDALWLAANGRNPFRDPRPTDFDYGRILKVHPTSGATLSAHRMPDGGGVHGIEWAEGMLWLTTLRTQTLSQVNPDTFEVLHRIPVPHTRAHGLAWDGGYIWCVHTSHRVIVKLDARDGRIAETIEVKEPHPEPHGLTLHDGVLWYCDAESGAICRILMSGT